VDTAETSTTTAFDTLTVSTAAGPLATFSNLNHNAGFSQHTVAVPGTGSIALTFTGVEGTKLQTSFVVDDVTLTAS
jgi:hypothetical protein